MAFVPKPRRETAAERRARRRDTKGYRQPVRRTNASNSAALALSKGPSRHSVKTKWHALEVATIKATREAVWRRSSVCETCLDTERESAAKWPTAEHEMNEIVERYKTRRLKPAERFNTAICCRQCRGCHKAFHDKQLRPLPLTPAGMDGAYDVQVKNAAGEWETVRTIDRKRGLRA